jgi:hypothetical protein
VPSLLPTPVPSPEELISSDKPQNFRFSLNHRKHEQLSCFEAGGEKGKRKEALNPRSDILPRMTISSADFYPAGPTLLFISPFAAQKLVDPCAVTAYYTSSHPAIFISSFYAMHPSLPMSARTGRSTARYTPGTNRRLCAGIVALSTGTTRDSPGHLTHVLVTSSSRHPERFVLPKGGWEQDESPEDAALREGWEEGSAPPHIPPTIIPGIRGR